MAAVRSAPTDAPADELAAAVREASFVRVLTRADGDALAAGGLLARACRRNGIPFQVRVSPRLEAPAVDDDGLTVAVGGPGGDACIGADASSAGAAAFRAAGALGDETDPVLALAGAVAAGSHPGEGETAPALEAAEASGALARRPGVAVPTADLADGLAHATLAHAPFSGDEDAARAALADLDLPAEPDEEAHRAVASLLAIETATAEGATPRAAAEIERALRPYETPAGPFETLGGYADVLDSTARERPGTAVALALGHDARTPALDAWREHARAVHAALREATARRYDGVFVAETGLDATGRAAAAARLLRDFRSPEPVALVVGDGVAAAASVEPRDLGSVMRDAAEELAAPDSATADGADAVGADEVDAGADGTVRSTIGYGGDRRAEARFRGDPARFVAAFREVLGR